MASECSCITDTTSVDLKGPPIVFPSRFLHLDELAPAGFSALYSSSTINTPFLVDIPRTDNDQPCCMCIHTIDGIFFSLNGSHIPTATDINPAFDSRLDMEYTWSRVPHGIQLNTADDGAFNGLEPLADILTPAQDGEVFTNFFENNLGSLSYGVDGGAFFPSSTLAGSLLVGPSSNFAGVATDPIAVPAALDAADPRLKGALPVSTDGNSRGENEQIILTMTFNTYVKITDVVVTFYAGRGLSAPSYLLALVPPANRTNDLITKNVGVVAGEALESAFESSIPGSESLDDDDIRDGVAKFRSRLIPTLDDLPFWETYGMEWQLIFPGRGVAQSMGIAAIDLKVDALTNGPSNTEVIGIRERKYYRSTGTPTDGNNPERFLGELDSATAYWRSTNTGAFKGDNRHRAYAWGNEVSDNQDRIQSSDIKFLESLQGQEYDNARALLQAPYTYTFQSFLPFDEEKWTTFFNEPVQEWTFTAANEISPIDTIINPSNSVLTYGEIPDRETFNAPGHAWAHNFEETYAPCCFGCVHSQLINFDFLHFHDNLALVETASFWSELPSGFTRLIRSTLMLADPTFQGGLGGVGSTVLIGEGAFIDAQGNAISTEVLDAAGFTRDPVTGQIYVDGSDGGAAVGGPAGPTNKGCGGE